MVSTQISQWIKFDAPTPPDGAIFTPLKKASGYIAGYIGPIQEGNSKHIIAIVWDSQLAHDNFKASPEYAKILTDLRNLSGNDPIKFTVDFSNIIFWPALGPNTELYTVYFPPDCSDATKEQIRNLNGLTMPHGLGIGGNLAHLSPYRKVPICGWIEETQDFHGKDAVPCLWINSWCDKEKEEEFKERKRLTPRDGESAGALILKAWEKELTDLGALGWDDIHVDFEMLWR